MTGRSPSTLTVVLGGAVCVAFAAVCFVLVQTQRRMERLEDRLAKAGAAAEPAPRSPERIDPWAGARRAAAADLPATTTTDTAPPARRPRRRDEEARAPAEPKMPEARRFAEDNELTELQWRTLTRLNEAWVESLQKAAKDGEDALPDKLDLVARQRDIKLRAVLGSEEAVADYRSFEGALHDGRVSYTAKDGTSYGAAPFE